jgi:LAO/AO transport system kinase
VSAFAPLVERALAFHALSIADLIAVFEDRRPDAPSRRRQVLVLLGAHVGRRRALLVGVTGPPGSGKSTLIGRLALALADRSRLSVAVVAVDPASEASGGALLGDRLRVAFPPDRPELFFRSQSSDRDLGGLGPSTFHVCRLLYHLFDVVLVETVGVGQSETDVSALVDRTYLVLSPLGGDAVQAYKAGVMEIPDAVIVNKCDEAAAARRAHAALEAALPLARPGGRPPALFSTSALTGEGIDALVDDVLTAARTTRSSLEDKEERLFRRWVRVEWGRQGQRLLDDAGGFYRASNDLEHAEERFPRYLADSLGDGDDE